MRKMLLLLLLFVSITTLLKAQTGENYAYLKKYILAQPKLKIDSSNFLSIYHNKELHYLYPIYKSITQENRLIANTNATQYLIDLSEALAFNGDYLSALEIEKKSFDSKLEDSVYKSLQKQADLFTGIEFKDSKKYV